MAKLIKSLKTIYQQATFKGVEPAILEAHREHLLQRAEITSIVVFVFSPMTVFPYFYLVYHRIQTQVIWLVLISMAASALLFLSLRFGFFRKHYHLPVFLLSAVIANFEVSSMFPLAGGGSGYFLFPYFLICFGTAILMPGSLLWIASTLIMLPISYAFVEWSHGVSIFTDHFVANLIHLIDAAFFSIVGNQILLSLFLRDKRNQLKLEAANEKLTKVSAQVAHDIRSPLASINACVRHWKDTSSLNADFMMILELSAKRLHSIANEMLDRQDEKPTSIFSLHKILDELIGEYESANPKIRFHKIYGQALSLSGDRDRLQRAFENIIKNAIEAMAGSGEITLKTFIERDKAVIEIGDSGPGMSAEKLAKVLKGGYTEGKKDGHGIGMQVVRETVEGDKGQLEGESQPGQGTTFRIKLPLPDSVDIKASQKIEDGAGFFSLNLKKGDPVVVIDDDPAAQLQWELMLRKEGVAPLTFESFEDFQSKAALRQPIQAAIVDYHYDNSELTGFQVIENLKRQGFDNITLCTGEYWKPSVQKKAKEMSVPVCPKPIPKIVLKAN